MYNDIPPALLAIVEPVVLDHGLELVDAHVHRGGGEARVEIVLDTREGDGRVNIELCAAVSRELSHGLDAADVLPFEYELEVTSPGVDRTLGRAVDFERVVGREVSVETRVLLGGRRRFRGTLLAFESGEARVQTDDGDFAIPFAQVRKAQAFYPFESSQQAKR